jgi:hypothetical protein
MMISWFKQAFLEDTLVDHPSQWRLLIMDNHGSHESEEFSQLALQHRIQPFYLPSNASHELQPLDVGCFSSLKSEYGRQIEEIGLFDITASGSKRRFVEAYKAASTRAFQPSNIRNGFKHSGINPFNPQHVLDRLKPPSPPKTPSKPRSQRLQPDTTIYMTPTNAAQLQQQVDDVYNDISNINRKHKSLARKWIKAFDNLVVQRAANKVENARIRAEAEANKQTRRRMVRPKDGELFVSPGQIQEEKEKKGRAPQPRRTPAAPHQSIPHDMDINHDRMEEQG